MCAAEDPKSKNLSVAVVVHLAAQIHFPILKWYLFCHVSHHH